MNDLRFTLRMLLENLGFAALAAFWRGLGVFALALVAGTGIAAEAQALADTNAVRIYTVNRKVGDFPDKEDMSTPEAAYATLNRLLAIGNFTFPRRFHVPWSSHQESEPPEKREVSAEERAKFLGAEILEVQLWHGTNATVFAQMPKDVDLRLLCYANGQWLNDGNDGGPTLDGARVRVTRIRAHRHARSLHDARPPIADPSRHLRPFVEFLEREAADPQEYLLRALAKHRVVILGEVHNRQRYWAFNAALVRSPVFAKHVGVIYLELPCNDQPLMDRFLAAPKYDPAPVIDVLRDMHEFGWPDQPTVEFCQAVYEVNQSLPIARRLALGLFESPFAALTNRPMAFPLDHGPFGEQLFDHSLDFTTTDPYRAGYDGFLCLGPLEDEIVSPLIPGFYTDEYAREIDRRLRLMEGHGLESIPEIGQVTGEAIRRAREAWWGQPRDEWRSLGPLEAWHHGSDWKQQLLQAKYREALKAPTRFRRETEQLFAVLRQTDYTQDWATLFPQLSGLNCCVQTDRAGWV